MSRINSQPPRHHLKIGHPAIFFLLSGLALLALSAADAFPAIYLAKLASQDGQLSQKFVGLLQRSQWTLAGLLILGGPLAAGLAKGWRQLAHLLVHSRPRSFLIVLAGAAFAASLWVQERVFDGIPHVTDASSHWFQAKILARGHLSAPLPPCHEHFFQHNVIMNPTTGWHTKYPPGQSLWLAWGFLAGTPWLPMPFGFAVATACFASLAERVFDRPTARIAALLFVSSPLLLLLSGSFMSHITVVTFGMASAAAFLVGQESANSPGKACGWLLLSGVLGGLALATRPADFVTLATTGLAALTLSPESRRAAVRYGAAWGLGFAGPTALLIFWNTRLFGSPFATGYYLGEKVSLTPIIKDSWGLTEAFTLNAAARQFLWTLLRFNKVLLGWPSSLLFLPCAFAFRTADRKIWICGLGLVLGMALYFFWAYYGFEFEARYYAAATPFALLLTARGILNAGWSQNVAATSSDPFRNVGARAVAAATLVIVFELHNLVYYWPQYLWPVYAHEYEQASPAIHRAARQAGLTNAIVLIPSSGPEEFRYTSGFVYNDPWLNSPILYARDLDSGEECLAAAFPSRTRYRFAPDPVESNGSFVPLSGDPR